MLIGSGLRMNNIFMDTGILSEIVWCRSEQNNLDQLRMSWDNLGEKIEHYIPGFSENTFRLITSDFLLLEIIGLGSVKEGIAKNTILTYKRLKSYVPYHDWIKYYDKGADFIRSVRQYIENYVETELSSRKLARQALYFERKYRCHELAHFIFSVIKDWRKEIKDQNNYMRFKQNLIWEIILKYPFIDFAQVAPKERDKAIKLWIEIIGTMLSEYYDAYNSCPTLLQVPIVGLFGEIHKICKFYTKNSTEGYDDIFKLWSDMVDAESIHYALMGMRKGLTINEPVTIITIDSYEAVERRLECLYTNLIEISKKDSTGKRLKINLCPGKIICCKFQNGIWEVTRSFEVENYIYNGLSKGT
jgi:hypothetical protein